MVVTELCNGQGLGNQLWSYVVTRTIALDNGYDFGIISPEKFKGKSFMTLDFGRKVIGGISPEDGPLISLPRGIVSYYIEKDTWYDKFKCDIRDYDPDVLSILDNTKIGGYFQSEKYILHRREEIRQWLCVKSEYDYRDFSKEDICVLNVRGGEYKGTAELILPRKYWMDAVANMLCENSMMRFVIITDDVKYARKLLPEYPAYHFDIGRDYSAVRNARYLILANSSFAFFPAWTSETVKRVIAPKYWARHNISDGFWACAFNLYRDWQWQDRDGKLFTYDECATEYEHYMAENGLSTLGTRPLQPYRSVWGTRAQKLLDSVSRLKHKLLDDL